MIERTTDLSLVREIVTHPYVWKWVSDDSVSSSSYIPPMVDSILWLKATDCGQLMGVYMVHPHNGATVEIHTCLLPCARGQPAKRLAVEVLQWIFDNTGYVKIITNVPENNPYALNYARRAGLLDEGINRKSISIAGKLYDQYMLGITKEDFKCQQQQ